MINYKEKSMLLGISLLSLNIHIWFVLYLNNFSLWIFPGLVLRVQTAPLHEWQFIKAVHYAVHIVYSKILESSVFLFHNMKISKSSIYVSLLVLWPLNDNTLQMTERLTMTKTYIYTDWQSNIAKWKVISNLSILKYFLSSIKNKLSLGYEVAVIQFIDANGSRSIDQFKVLFQSSSFEYWWSIKHQSLDSWPELIRLHIET